MTYRNTASYGITEHDRRQDENEANW
eukprot:COSAG01_NODE_29636_length_633_cov_1.050562_1_plen_25_part_10